MKSSDLDQGEGGGATIKRAFVPRLGAFAHAALTGRADHGALAVHSQASHNQRDF